MITFDNDEREYLRWIKANPEGFVINATKGKGYAMLHKATCGSISTDKQTNYTTHEYKKVCSLNRQELIEAGKRESDNFSLCKLCSP